MTDLEMIKEYFKRKAQRTNAVGLFEFGVVAYPKDCRFDLVLLSAHEQRIRGFEFKVNRADFLKDIRNGKWLQYLDFCHTFTWVCPAGLIHKNEILSPAGLLWIYQKEIHETWISITSRWQKIPQGLEIKQEALNKLFYLFIQRIKFRKDDFI